jgi:hypothetical protein
MQDSDVNQVIYGRMDEKVTTVCKLHSQLEQQLNVSKVRDFYSYIYRIFFTGVDGTAGAVVPSQFRSEPSSDVQAVKGKVA